MFSASSFGRPRCTVITLGTTGVTRMGMDHLTGSVR